MVLLVVHGGLPENPKRFTVLDQMPLNGRLLFPGPNATGKGMAVNSSRAKMQNLWAGTSAPRDLVTEVLYKLLMQSYHLEPLRAESEDVEDVTAKYGRAGKAITRLHLMDSFVLSNGPGLSAGTCVLVPRKQSNEMMQASPTLQISMTSDSLSSARAKEELTGGMRPQSQEKI